MKFTDDIIEEIKSRSWDCDLVVSELSNLKIQNEHDRVVRCILMLSDDDLDAVKSWIKTANIDYRDVLVCAEYDNRNIRKYDYNFPINQQKPYSYNE